MSENRRDIFDRGARILQRTMPRGKMTLGVAVSFWGNVIVFIVLALGMSVSAMLAFGLEPESAGGFVAIAILIGSIVAGITASGVANNWLQSRRIPALVGCAIVPIVAFIAFFIGWWLLLLLIGLAAIDTWRRRTGEPPPVSGE
jgi:hypothetical protein